MDEEMTEREYFDYIEDMEADAEQIPYYEDTEEYQDLMEEDFYRKYPQYR